MATPTTTYPLVRNGIRTVIEGLTPSTGAEYGYELYPGPTTFETWAEENLAASFRRFSLRRAASVDETERQGDGQVEQVRDNLELVIAYPHTFRLYGDLDGLSLDDVATEDAEQIRKALGVLGADNWVSGQSACWANYELQESELITYVVFDLTVIYYISAN